MFTYAGQVQVNGKSYEQLNQVTVWNLNTGPSTSISGVSGPVPVHFFRVSNDSVYYLIDNQEFLMYPVHAQVGDSWVFGALDTITGCLSTPTATVVGVGTDTINGSFWEYIEVINAGYGISSSWQVPDCNSPLCITSKIYRRAGPTLGTLPFMPTGNYCGNAAIDYYQSWLQCFDSGSDSLVTIGNGCLPAELGIHEAEGIQNVYPNPVRDLLTISLREVPKRVTVFASTGAVAFTAEPRTLEVVIDVSTWTPGIYWVKVQLDTEVEVVRKVVVM